MLHVIKQSMFSNYNSQAIYVQEVYILNSLLSYCMQVDSLYSQLTILILPDISQCSFLTMLMCE